MSTVIDDAKSWMEFTKKAPEFAMARIHVGNLLKDIERKNSALKLSLWYMSHGEFEAREAGTCRTDVQEKMERAIESEDRYTERKDRPGKGFPGPDYQTEGWRPTEK